MLVFVGRKKGMQPILTLSLDCMYVEFWFSVVTLRTISLVNRALPPQRKELREARSHNF